MVAAGARQASHSKEPPISPQTVFNDIFDAALPVEEIVN
jgi:hypothetical protein